MTHLFTHPFGSLSAAPVVGAVVRAFRRHLASPLAWLAASLVALGLSAPAVAQPTWLTGTIASSTPANYALTDLGTSRQARVQATAAQAAGTTAATWSFAVGGGTPDLTTNWRPTTAAQAIPAYNQLIDPSVSTGSARYNTASGGAPGRLLATTSGRYYTFNITENAGSDNFMAVLETSYEPANITHVQRDPAVPTSNVAVKVTAAISANNSGSNETVYLRYSTDGFASSTILTMVTDGSTTLRSATIPAQGAGATVDYYVFTAPVTTGVTSANADMLTLKLNNAGGQNYRYTYTGSLALSSGTYTINSSNPTAGSNFNSFTDAFNRLNSLGIAASGNVTFNVSNGAGYTEAPPVLTVGGSSSTNRLIFQKATSQNPLITFSTTGAVGTGGTSANDGIIRIAGADWVTFDDIDVQENASNTTDAARAEYGYATMRAANEDACQNVEIRNSTITLNKANTATIGIYCSPGHSGVAPGALMASTAAGVATGIKLNGNTISNAYAGIYVHGNLATGSGLRDNAFEVGTTTANTVSNVGGGGNTTYGIRADNQENLKIENNSVSIPTGTTGATVNGISTGVSNSPGIYGSLLINSNTVTFATATTSSQWGIRQAGTSNVTATTITGNKVQNCSVTASGGAFTGIEDASTNAALVVVITGNEVTGNSSVATNDFTGIYRSGATSTTTGTAVNLSSNLVQNNTKSGAGTLYGIRLGNQPAAAVVTASSNTVNNNQITAASGTLYALRLAAGQITAQTNTLTNNTITTSTGVSSSTVIGYYNFDSTPLENLTGNIITGLSIGGASTSTGHGVTGILTNTLAAAVKTISLNTIGGLSITGSGSGTVRGINQTLGTTIGISRNKIYDLSAVGTSGSAQGILISSGTTINITNNLIGNLTAPQASGGVAVIGIDLTSGTTNNVQYNTVYLNASSTSATFGTAGIRFPTSGTQDFRNNLVVNTSTAGTAGFTVALRRAASGTNGTPPSTLSTTTDYNLYYAGAASASNLLYGEGTGTLTNPIQTLAAYKALMGLLSPPREQNAKAELPATFTLATYFASVVGTDAGFLHLGTAPTQAEAGGVEITGLTEDYDLPTARSGPYPITPTPSNGGGQNPDIGADEGDYTPRDVTGPAIAYTLLGPGASSLPSRTLTATITDPSGVDVTMSGRPLIYFRKGTMGAFVSAPATSSMGNSYTFTITYASVGGVMSGDVIQYYVAAQDNAAPANPGTNPSGGSGTTPPGATAPGTLSQFSIIQGYAGTLNVGPTETLTSLTAAGGLFAALNAGALTGNLTVNITGDISIEDGANALKPLAEDGGANFSITIQPSAATLWTISGAIAGGSNNGIRFTGADRVTVDGRFGGSGRYLLFRNTNATGTAPVFVAQQEAQNITLRNLIIEGSGTSSAGALVFLGTSQTAVMDGISIPIGTGIGNDFFTLRECQLRNGAAGLPVTAFYSNGSTLSLGQANSDVTVADNEFSNFTQYGISTSTGNGSNWTISGNKFFYSSATPHTATTVRAMDLNANTQAANWQILNNGIGGSAADNSGLWTNSNTTASLVFRGIYINSLGQTLTTPGNVVVQGNTIQNISLKGTAGHSFRGIELTSSGPYAAVGQNVIQDISSNMTGGSATAPQFVGILAGSAAGNLAGNAQIYVGNTIQRLRLTASASTSWVAGILTTSSAVAVGAVSFNRIVDLTTAGTTAGGLIGVSLYNGEWTLTNNQIALTNTGSTIGVGIIGIRDETRTLSTDKFYFNSVRIDGAATTGTTKTYAFTRPSTTTVPTVDLRDNILLNERTGTGSHFAVGLGVTGSTTSTHNNLFSTTAGTLGETGVATPTAYPFSGATSWTSLGLAGNSTNVDVRFVDETLGNLNLDPTTNCQLDGAGVVINATINGEFDNPLTSRQTSPDIGSDEFSYTPQAAAITTSSPVCGTTTATVSLGGNGGPFTVNYTDNDSPTPNTGTVVSASPTATSVTFPAPAATSGTRTYSLVSVTDAYGCALTVSGSLAVNTPATVDAGPATAIICTGSAYTLGGTASGGATGGTWTTSGDGTFSPSATTLGATYTPGSADITNGTATLMLTSSGQLAPCTAATDQLTLTITGTTTWLGTSPNWYDAANWTACVPTSTISAVIPNTANQPVISSGTAEVNSLTVQTSAVLTINGTGNLDVYGTFTTASAAGFVAQAGTTTFTATAPFIPAGQYFSIALSGAKTLTGAGGVYGTLDLTGGSIDLGSFNLTLDPPAGPLASITGFGPTNYLITSGTGQVVFARTGGAATARQVVFFPIGTAGSYTPAQLTLSAVSSYSNAARGSVSDVVPIVIAIDPSGTHVVQKTWDIDWGTGTLPVGETGTLQLRWNTTDEGTAFDRTFCTVKHFEGGVWTHRTRDYAPATLVGGLWTRQRTQLTTFSPFAVEDYTQPLPVELVRFEVERVGANARLLWSTASEKDSKGFETQVSTDGRTFRTLGFVASPTPNATTARHYEFTDHEPNKAGARHYRLRQLDLDGTAQLSSVRSLTFGGSLELSAVPVPNPFRAGQLVVRLTAPAAGTARLTLTDAVGRPVFVQALPVAAGYTELRPLVPPTLAAGTYSLTTELNGSLLHERVVRE